jgi:hypothetical protein
MSAVPSGEPSSTTISSHSRPSSAVDRRSARRGSESASLYVGTTIDASVRVV